ncbi:hypothetical protein BY458DRAFT_479558 [Sporodiniella umbellata]|nr:hypothetical protein BY458DRAFT_479558 [Sporodiniella umbellata]
MSSQSNSKEEKSRKTFVYRNQKPDIPIDDSISINDLVLTSKYRLLPDNKLVYVDAKNPSQRLTFGELKRQAFVCAASFKKDYDLRPRDVVAVCSHDTIQYPIIFLAALITGCIFAPMRCSALSTPEETAQDLETIRPKLLILHHTELKHTFESAKKAGIPESHILMFKGPSETALRTIDDILESNEPATDYYHYSKEEVSDVPCCLYFTSGSTGQRKAVKMGQKVFLSIGLRVNVDAHRAFSMLTSSDFSFVSTLIFCFMLPFCSGMTAYILESSKKTMEELFETVEKYKISRIVLPPYMISELVKNPSLVEAYDLSSIQVVCVGGAFIDTNIIASVSKMLSAVVLNSYGMTECIAFVFNTPEFSLSESSGPLGYDIQARIVDENGNDLLPGEVGELRIKGPTVTKGYYRNPEATRELFDEQGYMKTGDICKIDENMLVYHIARLKELIRYKNVDIYPAQIERVLFTHPSVADCAVVGVFQKTEGTEYPRAYVTLVDGVECTEVVLKEIEDYANSKVSEDKWLRGGIIEMKKIPRTGSGKVKRFDFV